MHLDSKLSSNIQFADWIAGYLTRAIDRQLIEDSRYLWVGQEQTRNKIMGSFTYESKLHFYQRSVNDLNHSGVISKERPLYPPRQGSRIGDSLHMTSVQKILAAANKKSEQ